MGKNKLDEEDVRKYINHEIHLKVSSKGMEPGIFKSLSEASMFIGVSRQTFKYAHKHKRPLTARRKGGAKVFFIEWLESTEYLSQLDKYFLDFKTLSKFFTSKNALQQFQIYTSSIKLRSTEVFLGPSLQLRIRKRSLHEASNAS